MKKLLALLAAVGAVVFFWRKKHQGDDTSTWDTASDTASSWGDTTQDKAEDVADKAEDVADTAVRQGRGRRRQGIRRRRRRHFVSRCRPAGAGTMSGHGLAAIPRAACLRAGSAGG